MSIRLSMPSFGRSAPGALADAVRALPEEILHYKSVPPFRAALLAWLDERAR